MDKVAVVIPNYNGYRYLETCFAALAKQTFTEFTTYFVDNGSQDESCAFLREHYPETKIIQLDDNYGFSRAVNEGIRQSKEPYVILLNNDTEVFQDFVERLYEGICKRKNAFACSAKLISYQERDKIDDAGNYYNMLGWAFARGKGKPVSEFETSDRILRPAPEQQSTAGNFWKRPDFLTKNISLIWKIPTSAIVRGFWATRTGMSRPRRFTTSEAERAVPGITSLKSVILPGTIFI